MTPTARLARSLLVLALATLPALATRAADDPKLSGRTQPMPPPPGKPRLAFLELQNGPEVTKEVAQAAAEVLVAALSDTGKFDVITKADIKAMLGYEAQAQLLGCGEASCMVDLGGALGAAWLVTGSLGRLGGQLQLSLSLIDTNRASVARRASLGLDEGKIQGSIREAVHRLTGEVVVDAGPADACQSPPCAREAIAACKRWWEKEWDNLTIVGVVPDGPVDQKLVDRQPARIFRLLVRTRARNGERGEYLVNVRFKRVDGDWYYDESGMRQLRSLPIVPDDPPPDGELQKVLARGFEEARGKGAKVSRLEVDRFPGYERERAKDDGKAREPASWTYRMSVTFAAGGKTTICPRAEAKLVKAGKGWRYQAGRDGSCEEVLDQ